MQITINLDTDNPKDAIAFQKFVGAFTSQSQPATVVKVAHSTVDTHKGQVTPTDTVSAVSYTSPGDEVKAALDAQTPTEAPAPSLADMKELLGRFIVAKGKQGPEELKKLFAAHGATCLVGDGQLGPAHYAAVAAEVKNLLGA